MNTTAARPLRRRRLFAILSTLAVVGALVTPALAATSADAQPVGYNGEAGGHSGTWQDFHLNLMTEGVHYSDSVQLPEGADCFNADAANEPGEFNITYVEATGVIVIAGTPGAAGDFSDFTVIAHCTDGDQYTLSFDGTILSDKDPTTTTLVLDHPVSIYSDVKMSAQVASEISAPTGQIEFYADGTLIDTESVDGGGMAYAEDLNRSLSDSGHTVVYTATYTGDENYLASDSDEAPEYLYGSKTVKGKISVDGDNVSGAQVDLMNGPVVLDSSITGVDGKYSLIAPVATVSEAQTTYSIRATILSGTILTSGTQLWYTSEDGATSATSAEGAELTGPADWSGDGSQDIYYNFAPTWTDQSIQTPRHGSEYSDGVLATGTGAIDYTVSDGSLPDGLHLNSESGAITGTPTNEDEYDFTVSATNDYGHVDKRFTGTVLVAHLAPTWEETDLAAPQESVSYSDSVTAVGDPTIVYSVVGALPPGLELNTATGALTGKPTDDGSYAFQLTATNDYGHVDQSYLLTVGAAPDLGLVLDFEAGTSIDDATTTIGASGLKVGSTYTLTLHSDPRVLVTAIVDGTGGFHSTVTIPADTTVGSHELILSGIAPDGSTLTAHAWFTLLDDGTIGAISYTGPLTITIEDVAKMASTGVTITAPLEFGVAALVLGALLLLRRRRQSQQA